MNNFGRFILILSLIVVLFGVLYLSKYTEIANGFNAKSLCSCTFIAERNDCQAKELKNYWYLTKEVDLNSKTVESSLYGFLAKKAIYRKGLGCTLVDEDYNLQKPKRYVYERPRVLTVEPWALGERVENPKDSITVNHSKLNLAIDAAFSEPYEDMTKETRAVLVVYKGEIIAERYADGFTKSTPQLGWSMTKSLINALTGVMVKDGLVTLDEKVEIDEWKNDSRKNITIDNLLRMNSGLHFEEEYAKPSAATEMLFDSYSAASVAINQEIYYPPGEKWYYSSGTTNILTKYLMDKLSAAGENPVDYIYNKLFYKLGMYSMEMEVDASGYFVGSSFSYATPRDWARFGMFYLEKGVWNGEQILPSDWVRYTRTPTEASDSLQYGAHFWMNAGLEEDKSDRKWKDLPSDLYYPAGYQGQYVFIIPSMDLVIVRMGMYSDRDAWSTHDFLERMLTAFPQKN